MTNKRFHIGSTDILANVIKYDSESINKVCAVQTAFKKVVFSIL